MLCVPADVRRLVRVAAALLCACVLAAPTVARAQAGTAGAVSGVILDPDGRATATAAVMGRNESPDAPQPTTPEGSGHFRVAGLAPGLYTIEGAVPASAIIRRNGVPATAGR